MSIEVQISKLTEALDRNTASNNQLFGLLSNHFFGSGAEATPVVEKPKDATPAKAPETTYTEQRKAEIQAEAGKRGPGRPKKGEEKVKAITPPEPEKPPVVKSKPDDDFLAAPTVKVEPVTIDEVRNKLIELREKKGKDVAYSTLFNNGNKASLLPGSKAAEVADQSGVLKPEFYDAVYKATLKALE